MCPAAMIARVGGDQPLCRSGSKSDLATERDRSSSGDLDPVYSDGSRSHKEDEFTFLFLHDRHEPGKGEGDRIDQSRHAKNLASARKSVADYEQKFGQIRPATAQPQRATSPSGAF